MAPEFAVGMKLNINDESVGEIMEVSGDRVFIESDCFRGWASKSEIENAILTDSAKATQSQNMQPEPVPSDD